MFTGLLGIDIMRSFENMEGKDKDILKSANAMEFLKRSQDESIRWGVELEIYMYIFAMWILRFMSRLKCKMRFKSTVRQRRYGIPWKISRWEYRMRWLALHQHAYMYTCWRLKTCWCIMMFYYHLAMGNGLKVQPIAFGVSLLQSRISIDNLVLYVSFATFRWKETKEIEIGDWDLTTLHMQ